MTFVSITPDGQLHVHPETPTSERISELVGGPWDMCRSLPLGLVAFVHDTGIPDGLPRNIEGSCVLAASYFPQQVYAGPIVITGWDEYGQLTEVTDLRDEFAQLFERLLGDVRYALTGEGERTMDYNEVWASFVRQAAEHFRTCPDPGIQIAALNKDGSWSVQDVSL